MKGAWCLVASFRDVVAGHLRGWYGKCWAIECGIRDTRKIRFGMDIGSIHIGSAAQRDRIRLLNALAIAR